MTDKSKLSAASLLAENGLLRLPEVLRVIPISRSTVYAKIKAGSFPAPVQVTQRVVAWRSSDIRTLIENLERAR